MRFEAASLRFEAVCTHRRTRRQRSRHQWSAWFHAVRTAFVWVRRPSGGGSAGDERAHASSSRRRALVASVLHDRRRVARGCPWVPAGAHGYAYARRHRTSSARPPLPLWAMEAEGPAARGHRMIQARVACPTALGASHQQVAHRGFRFNAPAWSSGSLGAHGGDTARKAASTGEVPIRWMGRLETAVAGGGAAA